MPRPILPQPRSGPASRHALVLLLLGGAIGVAYAGALQGGLVFDSRVLIAENPTLRGATWSNVVAICTHDYWYPAAVNGLYRPLVTLSYLVNYSVLGNGERPLGYHLVNLLLHWGCAALVYALVFHLLRDRIAAALAAALFALHPVATEAVTNVVGRADLLAALGVLAGLLCAARARVSRGRRRRCWLAGLACATGVAVLSKENAPVLLPLLLVWDLVLESPAPWRERMRRLAPALGVVAAAVSAMALAGAWVRAHEWPAESSPLDNPILSADFWSGRATALTVIGLQLWSLVWPLHLSADYSYDQIAIARWPPGAPRIAAGVAVVALLGAALALRRREPRLTFFILFYFIALLPTANLIVRIGSIMADRFLYLPLVGFAAAVVTAAFDAARGAAGRRLVAALLAAAVLLAGWRTVQHNRDWTSEETLWASAVTEAPRSAKAHKAYAAALFARDPSHADIEAAIAEVQTALAIRPDYAPAMLDLASYLLGKGDVEAARGGTGGTGAAWYAQSVSWLQRARVFDRRAHAQFLARLSARGTPRRASVDYGNPDLYRMLGLADVRLGHFERARAAYRYARRLDPWQVQTYVDIAAVDANMNHWEDAAAALWQARTLDAANADVGDRLIELYRLADPSGTSFVAAGPGRVQVALDAPLVRRHRCRAYRELSRIFNRARLPDVATRARRAAAQTCAGSDA
jgi:protein O-mannosyl-transferase